jgi:hypothetical protein
MVTTTDRDRFRHKQRDGKKQDGPDRNHYTITTDGHDGEPLWDFASTEHHATARVHFRNLEDQLCSYISASPLVVGAVAWLTREAESSMEELAQRRAQIAVRLEALDRERRDLFTQMRKAGASASDMAEQVRLMREEESSLRAELEPLAAQMAIHQANLPRAEQITALCALFVKRAQGASATTKRELLDALETTVVVTGTCFRVEGVLSALNLEGDLTVQECASSS